ncbi:MAG TPA: hypothetical protein VH539_15110 [Gemmatimonadaceae bacterium]
MSAAGAKTTHPLFIHPDLPAALEKLEHAATPADRTAVIQEIRALVNVPDGGVALRSWLRYHLQNTINRSTGKLWNQADIGREAGDASGATVSRVFMGELQSGKLSDAIRRVTAKILGLPQEVIWKPAELCPECGTPLRNGGHDTGDDTSRGAVRWSPKPNAERTRHRRGRTQKSRRRSVATPSPVSTADRDEH